MSVNTRTLGRSVKPGIAQGCRLLCTALLGIGVIATGLSGAALAHQIDRGGGQASASDLAPGMAYQGNVANILEYAVFVNLPGGKMGLATNDLIAPGRKEQLRIGMEVSGRIHSGQAPKLVLTID